MRNRILLALGAALIAFAICLYGLLHDITALAAFSFLKQGAAADFYRALQANFHSALAGFSFFKIIKNYCVDALWMLSLLSLLSASGWKKAAPLIAFLCGAASEGLQAAKPRLGTFDAADLLLYAAICGAWFLAGLLLAKGGGKKKTAQSGRP